MFVNHRAPRCDSGAAVSVPKEQMFRTYPKELRSMTEKSMVFIGQSGQECLFVGPEIWKFMNHRGMECISATEL